MALRREMRARRLAFFTGLDPAALAAANAAVAGRVIPHLAGARLVAGYIAMGGEVDPATILAAAPATALPLVGSRDAPMQFRLWSPGDPLFPGPLGLLQPSPDALPAEPDLILTPLVAFDRALGRLGQGASYYDRAFALLPVARRIGLAWSVQQADAPLPADPWDVRLHAVATEREWIAP